MIKQNYGLKINKQLEPSGGIERGNKYLCKNKHNRIIGILNYEEVLYTLCQIACSVLIVYYCWYVEAFSHWGLVVNGTFFLMIICVTLLWLFHGKIHFNIIPFGIWNQFIMILYCLVVGFFVVVNETGFIHSIRQYLIYSVIIYSMCFVSWHKKSFIWILRSINIAILIDCFQLIFFGYHYSLRRICLSEYNNPNTLGLILNLGLFSVMYRSKVSIKSMSWVIPEVVVIIYNIIMTGSRKSLLVSLILFVFWALSLFKYVMKEKNKVHLTFYFVALFAIVYAFSYYYNSFFINTAVFDRMGDLEGELTESNRITMYRDAIQIFLEHPVFGCGLNQFSDLSQLGVYSHSTYAEAISCFGTIGSMIYFSPFLYAIYKLVFNMIHNGWDVKKGVLLGLCVSEVFLGSCQIWFYDIGHFFCWAMILLCIQIYNNQSSKAENVNLIHKFIR